MPLISNTGRPRSDALRSSAAVAEWRDQLRMLGWTRGWAAEQAGLSRRTLYTILAGRDVHPGSIERLRRVLESHRPDVAA
jgi:hypothetical protein